jgi:uncharacterized membrane protein YbhN (UPF0104 family)
VRHRGRLADRSWGPPARAVVLERFSGVVALALFVLASALVWLLRGRSSFWSVFAGAALVLSPFGLLLSPRVRSWRSVERFSTDVRAALVERGALAFQLSVSLAHVAALMIMFAFAARAANVVLEWATVVQIVPLVLATTTLPWAFAGWGAREVATAALFQLVGRSAADGVAVSVTFGLVSLISALPGVIVLCLPHEKAS